MRLTPSDEGSLWLLFFDDPCGEPVVASAIDGGMAHLDEILPNLLMIIDDVGAKAVLLAVPRRSGRPQPVDRRLWRELRTVSVSPEILDLVVVGDHEHWSATKAAESD